LPLFFFFPFGLLGISLGHPPLPPFSGRLCPIGLTKSTRLSTVGPGGAVVFKKPGSLTRGLFAEFLPLFLFLPPDFCFADFCGSFSDCESLNCDEDGAAAASFFTEVVIDFSTEAAFDVPDITSATPNSTSETCLISILQ
jgi:hypothetical protein